MSGNMRLAFVLAVLSAGLRLPQEEGGDRITTVDRPEVRGRITRYDPEGILHVAESDGGRSLRIPVEEVVRLRFGGDANPKPGGPEEQVFLRQGGMLSGKVRSYEGGVAVVENAAGTFRLNRGDIRSITFGPVRAVLPEIREEKADLLILDVEKEGEGGGKPRREGRIEYGTLLSMGEKVVFRSPEGEKEAGRGEVREVVLFHEKPPADPWPGRYAKVVFRNGDRLPGVIRSIGDGKVRLFSHLVGDFEAGKEFIESIVFIPSARLMIGRVLVCDSDKIREFGRQGREFRETWTSASDFPSAWGVQRLEDGNILVADTNRNRVVEMKPSASGGGEVVWSVENILRPMDASRLGNGNTLVVESGMNRVIEVDRKSKAVVWKCTALSNPTSAQRLENGNTLICSRSGVAEVGRDGREKWRAQLDRVMPWRARRLEDGHTLIVDMEHGQVVEVDARSRVVWRQGNLRRPAQACRLEDGNTLILESDQQRVIEVDPSHRVEPVITGLSFPMGLEAY